MPAAWKKFAALVVLAALGPAPTSAAEPPAVVLPLTQFEVLGLVQQGLGDEAVIARLRETRSTFRLSANDVQVLKALGVSSRVLAAMTGDAPRPLPIVQAAAIAPAPVPLVGSWVREFDGMQVVLKFTDKRMFATLNLAYVRDGKLGEQRMTFRADADYAVGPDGSLFGVITGTDFTPPRGGDTDTAFMLRMFPGLNGMPFCFWFRIDDGVMNLRHLRFAENGDRSDDVARVLGRYTRVEKEPAPPKAVKMPGGCDGPGYRPPLPAAPDIRPIGEIAPMPRPVPVYRLRG